MHLKLEFSHITMFVRNALFIIYLTLSIITYIYLYNYVYILYLYTLSIYQFSYLVIGSFALASKSGSQSVCSTVSIRKISFFSKI